MSTGAWLRGDRLFDVYKSQDVCKHLPNIYSSLVSSSPRCTPMANICHAVTKIPQRAGPQEVSIEDSHIKKNLHIALMLISAGRFKESAISMLGGSRSALSGPWTRPKYLQPRRLGRIGTTWWMRVTWTLTGETWNSPSDPWSSPGPYAGAKPRRGREVGFGGCFGTRRRGRSTESIVASSVRSLRS